MDELTFARLMARVTADALKRSRTGNCHHVSYGPWLILQAEADAWADEAKRLERRVPGEAEARDQFSRDVGA